MITEITNKYFILFDNPIDVDDNLLIWAKCNIDLENKIPEPYKIYQERINDKIKYYLKDNGFCLDGIIVSQWRDYNNIEVNIARTLLNMNSLRQQITSHTKKTAQSWGIECLNNKFRIILITFKRKSDWKRIKTTVINLSEFFNEQFKTNQIDNPFSRSFSNKLKIEIFTRDNYTCQCCGWKNGISGQKDRILTLDHIVPIAFGGTSTLENLRVLCLQCNIKKNDKIMPYLTKKLFKDQP